MAMAMLALAASLGITYWTWRGARDVVEDDRRTHFEYSVRDAEARIAQRMLGYEQVLRAAAGLFASSDEVQRREFRDFVASLRLDDRYPGMQGVGWSLIVPASSIDSHTAAVRREGFPDYSVRPAGLRDAYTSIVYLEPFAGRNLRAFGYDMFSEPTRRAAMERARDSGSAALSGKVTLVQETETDVQPGVLMYVPVYGSARVHDTIAERRARVIGWVYAPFRLGDLMAGIFGERALDLDVAIFDGAEPSLSRLLWKTGAPADTARKHSEFRVTRPLEIGGHRWTLLAQANPTFEAHVASDRPHLLAFGGVIGSVLLASVVWLLASGRARALREARALNRDITERKRAEEALRTSEERLRQTLKYAEAGTWEWNLVTDEVLWSAESYALLGIECSTRPATFGDWEECVHPDDLARVGAAARDAVSGITAEYVAEYRVRHSRRGLRWVLAMGRVERAADGTPTRMLGINIDITDRKSAEGALRRSEERFRALIEKATDMTLILDADDRFVFWSPSASEALGWAPEEVLGLKTSDLTHPEDAARAREAFTAILGRPGASVSVSIRVRHKDGSWRLIESLRRNLLHDSAVEGVVVNARDVTEQRRLEDQLRQSHSLESIGRLAGGIAHDFNNLLTVILAGTEQLNHDVHAGVHADLEIVQEIDTAAGRARDLTSQLLAFARRQMIAPIVLDLNALVLDASKLLRRVLGEDVEFAVSLDPSLSTVRCDPTQIEQIIVNLAINARDAMPRGGCLTIETNNIHLAPGPSTRGGDAPAGSYVRLAVRDSGCGMSADIKAHLFEPFFTTKPAGKGTGLGLATVYGIVKQSNGYIRVESEPGQGSTFEILFPRALAIPVATTAPRALVGTRGTETILVVEDDPLVREVTVRSLRSGGYEVLTAASGREALAFTDGDLARVTLLLTDVVMPGMDGRTLADELRARHPALSVLYVSGYTHDTIAQRGVLASGIGFLAKPFTAPALLSRVRAVIDGACAAAAAC
jgi:PAS domain S-box-containing protein